jgi:hypothetical protein
MNGVRTRTILGFVVRKVLYNILTTCTCVCSPVTVKTWLTFSGRWSSQQQHTDTASSFSYNTVTVQLYSFLLPVK